MADRRRQRMGIGMTLDRQDVCETPPPSGVDGVLSGVREISQHERVDGHAGVDDRLQAVLAVQQGAIGSDLDRLAVQLPLAALHRLSELCHAVEPYVAVVRVGLEQRPSRVGRYLLYRRRGERRARAFADLQEVPLS